MQIRGVSRLMTRLLIPALLLAYAGPAHADARAPQPILNVDFPDPAVVATGAGLIAYSTGDLVPHAWSRRDDGRWHRESGVLTRRPSWSREGGMWAVDVARVRGRWLLYYAAPVRGMGEHGRCIGVARATSPRGPFRPVGRAPLVCPTYAKVPQAQDPLLPRDPTLPRRGELSREILRSEGIIENPVLTQRPEGYVLLISEGDWTRCSHRTRWLRSTDLLDWTAAETGLLLDTATTGLCGPGGADLVEAPGRPKATLFLHGWTDGVPEVTGWLVPR